MMSRHQLGEHFGGYRPALPDHRLRTADHSGIKVLPEVDPRANMMSVYNQFALGACTIHAIIGQLTYDTIRDGHAPTMLCRFQGYWGERQKEGSLGQGDTGATGSDGLWVAQHDGFAPETLWPYTWPGQDQNEPPDSSVFDPAGLPAAVKADLGFYKLTKPYAQPVLSEQAFKAVLSNGQTIAFGFTVYDSFEAPAMASTGIMPMPAQGENILGGHEALCVGYLKAEPNYALVRNSWGTGWGLDSTGYFLMPWSFLLSSTYCQDWRTVQRPAGR